MANSIYHEVLLKIYELTNGKADKIVDLIKLTKDLGLFGNYANIYEYLTKEGWIAQSSKSDFVGITPFGVIEVKKFKQNKGEDPTANFLIEIKKSITSTRELLSILQDCSENPNSAKKTFSEVEKKLADLQNNIGLVKENLP